MCSIGVNATADAQIQGLTSDTQIIENKLRQFADDSRMDKPGFLDATEHHLTRMPADLKSMRRIRIGRHRVYYTGSHDQCSFTVFFVKSFKKSGQQDEDDAAFQRLLAGVIGEAPTRLIRNPDEPMKAPLVPSEEARKILAKDRPPPRPKK